MIRKNLTRFDGAINVSVQSVISGSASGMIASSNFDSEYIIRSSAVPANNCSKPGSVLVLDLDGSEMSYMLPANLIGLWSNQESELRYTYHSTLDKQRICVDTQLKSSKKQLK